MSFSINSLANAMFPYIDQSGTAGPSGDVANAAPAEKTSIALAITQALQETRQLNPAIFSRRTGTTLPGAAAGTVTVTNGSDAVTLGTLPAPANDGCTIRIDGALDNQLNRNPNDSPGVYHLARPHEGASGTFSASLWNDCWNVDDGTTYESILGAVKANGRPIEQVRSEEQLLQYRLVPDFGVPAFNRIKQAGIVFAVMGEAWASPYTHRIELRLRFYQMPAAQTVIEADLVVAAPTIAAGDLATTTANAFQIPQQLDEILLFPIAMKKFMAQPTFRAPAETRNALDEQYKAAVEHVRHLRGFYGAHARIDVRA
jgi:hypothetical protein